MTRDLEPTREAVWQAVYEFESISHLAVAMKVSRDGLLSWLSGSSQMTVEQYESMLEIVAAKKASRR